MRGGNWRCESELVRVVNLEVFFGKDEPSGLIHHRFRTRCTSLFCKLSGLDIPARVKLLYERWFVLNFNTAEIVFVQPFILTLKDLVSNWVKVPFTVGLLMFNLPRIQRSQSSMCGHFMCFVSTLRSWVDHVSYDIMHSEGFLASSWIAALVLNS